MKKLGFILILLYLLIPNVYAEEKAKFSVNTIKTSPGQEITVNVSLENISAYQLLSLEMPLDTSQVRFLSCKKSDFSSAMMSSCDINPNNEIIFYALTLNTNEEDLLHTTGNILEIKLQVLEKAKSDIPLVLKVTSFGKNDTEPISYDVENGYIRISGDIEVKAVNEKENLSNQVKKEVTWDSSDSNVATIDEDGNIDFTSIGNTTIVAKDKDGKVVYEKTYLVNSVNTKSNNNFFYWILGTILIIGISFYLYFFLFKTKKGKA